MAACRPTALPTGIGEDSTPAFSAASTAPSSPAGWALYKAQVRVLEPWPLSAGVPWARPRWLRARGALSGTSVRSFLSVRNKQDVRYQHKRDGNHTQMIR